MKASKNLEWQEYIELFKSQVAKYDYNISLNKIKGLSESREKIEEIAKEIIKITTEKQYINDSDYYNNFITKLQHICPKQNYEKIIDAISDNIAQWNLLSVNLYIREIEDMITIFPNRRGELGGQIKKLKKLIPKANINDYMTNYSIPFEDTDVEDLQKVQQFWKSLIEKAIDEKPFLSFFATKDDFRKFAPQESFHLIDFFNNSLRDSNGYIKDLNIKSSLFTIFNLHCQVTVQHHILFCLNELNKKYSPDYAGKIFELLADKINFLEPYEKETLKIALTYGFHQQFIVTSYIIPAFCEKIFTKILLSKDFDLNLVKGDLIERKPLTTYFNPDLKEYKCLMEIFEESDLYDLYMILIITNFRNNVYHGKELNSLYAIYLWYVFVRLILGYKKS